MASAPGPLHHEDSVFGKTRAEVEIRGRLVRLTHHAAVLQIHDPATPIALSDVLTEITLQSQGLPAYRGRGVVASVADLGTHLVVGLELDPGSIPADYLLTLPQPEGQAGLSALLDCLDQQLRIRPEFKLAVADLHAALSGLQRWTDQLQLGAGALDSVAREAWAAAAVEHLAPHCLPLMDGLFERYEAAAASLPEIDRPTHRAYVQRVLHPIVLCAPFAHRTYHKPLGYAGDYEMVNMMMGAPSTTTNLFALLFNRWLLHQDSAVAHRNRIHRLTERLTDIAAAAARAKRRARIYNLGCGPCRELQLFFEQSALSDQVDFTLADFDSHALDHARRALQESARRHHRRPGLTFIRKSIRELLRESRPDGGILGEEGQFDLVYCAGLFDYLTDTVCRQFAALGCRSLRPGGTFLCTNVAPSNPNRGSMELILDWHLYHRDLRGMRRLVPAEIDPHQTSIHTEWTGSNIFLEIVQPDDR